MRKVAVMMTVGLLVLSACTESATEPEVEADLSRGDAACLKLYASTFGIAGARDSLTRTYGMYGAPVDKRTRYDQPESEMWRMMNDDVIANCQDFVYHKRTDPTWEKNR